MPRHARLRVAGVPFHVVQRGHNRTPCFFSEGDRAYYLDTLSQCAASCGVAVHAYVLMTNHVHLLMTGGGPDAIPGLMKLVGQRYVRHVNKRQQRSGTLWEGRYRSCLVDTEGYLLMCHRYIELNPVRAGMAAHPGDYAWSSYRANARGEPDPVVSPHPLVAELGRHPDERCAEYRRMFDEGLAPHVLADIRACTNGGFAFGSDCFKREMTARVQRRVTPLPRGGSRVKGVRPL